MPKDLELSELKVPFVGNQLGTKQRATAWIVGLVVVLVGGFFGVQAMMHKPTADTGKHPVLTVSTEPVSTMTAERKLEVSGSIWPSDPISVGSEVGGLRVLTVNAEEGQFVKRGQVLATLNSSILRAQLAREQARLRQMEANFSKAKQPNRTYEIAAIKFAFEQTKAIVSQEEANVEHARAALNNAHNLAARYMSLAKQGAVSEQDADNNEAAELIAQADMRNAQQRLAAANAAAVQAREKMNMFIFGGRAEDVTVAAATVDETRANIQQIQSQIEQTIIRAPADGLITKRDVHIGDIGTAMQTKAFFTMIRDNKLEVRAQVPETDLPRLREGQAVEFTSPSGNKFKGVITIITPQIDPETRLATLRIGVPFANELRPGIFVHGEVKLAAEQLNVVPTKAVVARDDYNFVYSLDGDHVVGRNVRLGDRFGDKVEVVSGLTVGEPVVVTGAGFLKDGDVVRLTAGGAAR
jgi:HlyD family secretion protein